MPVHHAHLKKNPIYVFRFTVPVGVDTYGAYVTKGIKLVKQIGQKNQEATGEKLSTFFSISKYVNGSTTRQCSLC